MNKNKTELKIFLTFLLVSVCFIHWVGWNEESRIALTKSIVKEGRIEIDNYSNFTGDKMLYNGRYYSDKAPGTSFFATPIYIFVKFLSRYFPDHSDKVLIPQMHYDSIIYTPFHLSVEDSFLQILSVIFLSSLPGALLIVLIYKTSRFFVKGLNGLFVALSFGFCTILLPYSTVLMGNILATFLAFLGIYIILGISIEKINPKHIFLSGILLGASIVIDYLMVIVFVGTVFLLFFSVSPKKLVFKFFTGVLIGSLPLLVYNFLIFSNPFKFTFFYIVLPTYLQVWEEWSPTLIILKMLILFNPYRGLFFYTPFLLFSLPGLFYLYKDNTHLAIFLLFLFLSFTLLMAFYSYWHAGSSFGPRYLVPIIPFLSIPFFIFLKKALKKIHLKIILFLFLCISFFHIIIGLSSYWEGLKYIPFKDGFIVKVEWSTKSFEVKPNDVYFLNPLYEHYLPAFIQDGLRSRIIEGMFYDFSHIDIRDFKHLPVREIKLFTLQPFGILVLKLPFLVVPILLLILILIWKKELSEIIFRKVSIVWFLLFLLCLLFLSRLEFKRLVYGKDWYPLESKEGIRWMSKEGTIYIFSPKRGEVFLNISLMSYKKKTLELFLNNKFVSSFTQPSQILEKITLESGENVLSFRSVEGCEGPMFKEKPCLTYLECIKLNLSILNFSFDPRCLSFAIKNITILDMEELLKRNETIIFNKNWYNEEKMGKIKFRWMSTESEINILVKNSSIYKIFFNSWSFDKNRTVKIYLDDKLISAYEIPKEMTQVKLPLALLSEGEHTIKFSVDKCDYPKNDLRCLSIAVSNFTIVDATFLLDKLDEQDKNWYDLEKDSEGKSFRWISQNAELRIFNPSDNKRNINVSFIIWSYYKPRSFYIYIKGKEIVAIDVFGRLNYNLNLELDPGMSELTLSSLQGCDIPAEIEISDDKRCLSFAISELKIIRAN